MLVPRKPIQSARRRLASGAPGRTPGAPDAAALRIGGACGQREGCTCGGPEERRCGGGNKARKKMRMWGSRRQAQTKDAPQRTHGNTRISNCV